MSRWLDRRSVWQFALIYWAGTMAALLAFLAAVAAWDPGHVHRGSLVQVFFLSTGNTVGGVYARRRRRSAVPGEKFRFRR